MAANPRIKVTVSQVGGRITPVGSGYVTLKNQGAAAATPTTIAAMTDVNTGSGEPEDRSTLVYNANTNVYDVKQLPIDGGSF